MTSGKKRRSGKSSKPRKRTLRKPSEWQKSSTFKRIARSAIVDFNRTRHLLAKCGAKTRSGDPCRNPAMKNGKCRVHGGATPGGKQWGLRQINTKSSTARTPSDWRRAEAKLKKWERQDRDRIRRLRRMTDQEFWGYLRRLGRRANDPYAPTFAAALAEERRRRGPDPFKPSLALLPEPPKSAELEAIESEIEKLRAELAAQNLGVFG